MDELSFGAGDCRVYSISKDCISHLERNHKQSSSFEDKALFMKVILVRRSVLHCHLISDAITVFLVK